jgi:hypothetical protein
MANRKWFHGGIAGLMMALGGLVGCEGGGGEPRPETGGAGIPGLRGPAAPKGKASNKVGQGPAARRAAPAPVSAPTGGETSPPASPKE